MYMVRIHVLTLHAFEAKLSVFYSTSSCEFKQDDETQETHVDCLFVDSLNIKSQMTAFILARKQLLHGNVAGTSAQGTAVRFNRSIGRPPPLVSYAVTHSFPFSLYI